MAPRTRYAKSGEINIAYQVVGEDLVVGCDLSFEDRARHVLKGVPGAW